MKMIAKILRFITRVIHYPFFWMLECFLALVCVIFDEIEKMMEEDI